MFQLVRLFRSGRANEDEEKDEHLSGRDGKVLLLAALVYSLFMFDDS
jgi:hypothetical protein